MRRFCPKCGSEKGELVGGFCASCYWEKALEDFPRELRATVCKYCYRHLHGKRWIQRTDMKGEERIVEAAVAEAERQLELPEGVEVAGIAGAVSARSEDGEPSTVEVTVRLEETGSGQEKEAKVLVAIDHQLCHECYCAATGKYDAIVQVRAEGRALDALDRESVEGVIGGFSVRSEERGKTEISQVKDNEGGIDIKFTDLNPAKMFAKELASITGADLVESARIVGIDKRTGGRTYRTTIAVKLPDLRVGDMLEIDGRIFRVSSFHRGRTVIEPLSEPGAQRSASQAQLEGAQRVRGEDVKRVRLESVTEQFGTFLDLDGNCFFELPAGMVLRSMQPGDGGLLISVGGREYLVKTRPVPSNL
jgi:nonsense-mediated mRNA decay protein 3